MAAHKRANKRLRRLPRGRHGLSPTAVAEAQRERLLTAMLETVAGRGYADTRVGDVLETAQVSRKTFYELFADKEECFLAAYELGITKLLTVTADAYEAVPDAPWHERVRAGLAALLATIAAEPAIARCCIVEVLAAGPRALARRDAALREFTHFLEAGRSESDLEPPGITALSLVGGINELLYSEILHGAVAQVPARLPEILYWVLQPYLGSARAADERDVARDTLQIEGEA